MAEFPGRRDRTGTGQPVRRRSEPCRSPNSPYRESFLRTVQPEGIVPKSNEEEDLHIALAIQRSKSEKHSGVTSAKGEDEELKLVMELSLQEKQLKSRRVMSIMEREEAELELAKELSLQETHDDITERRCPRPPMPLPDDDMSDNLFVEANPGRLPNTSPFANNHRRAINLPSEYDDRNEMKRWLIESGMGEEQILMDTPVFPLHLALERPEWKVNDDPVEVYKLPLRKLKFYSEMKLRKCEYGDPPPFHVHKKTLLVIGETGTGKSTMIDSMMNYWVAVPYEKKVRFQIVDLLEEERCKRDDQSQSQTEWITCYTIHQDGDAAVPFSINIIDTPGFGDTRGLKRDDQIIEQIKTLFKSTKEYGLDRIDAICFIVKANTTRLTPTQRYIFDKILSIFAKDLADNILVLCSFADDELPPVLSALEHGDVGYRDSFFFNNKCLTASSTLGKHYWDFSMSNWKRFFSVLQECPPHSLKMSLDVILEREDLLENVEALSSKIKERLQKLNTLEKAKDKLKLVQEQAYDDVEINVPVTRTEKVPEKFENINCESCRQTCRRNCSAIERFRFSAKNKSERGQCEKCAVCSCPNKTHVRCHWRYTYVEKLEKYTAKTMSKGFESKIQTGLTIIQYIEGQCKDIEEELLTLFYKVQTNHNRLQKLALKPMMSSLYIDQFRSIFVVILKALFRMHRIIYSVY